MLLFKLISNRLVFKSKTFIDLKFGWGAIILVLRTGYFCEQSFRHLRLRSIGCYPALPTFRSRRKMAELNVAKSRRGIARASLTRLEKHIIKFEGKLELSKMNRQTVQRLIEKVQSLDDTFKEHHYVIADEAEEEAMETEQTVLDEHEHKLFSYTNRLRQLVEGSKPGAVPTLTTDP